MPEPTCVKAIDLKPHHYKVACDLDGRCVNIEVTSRRWSPDGKTILFGLDNHCTFQAQPDEDVEVIPYTRLHTDPFYMRALDQRDDDAMRDRPEPFALCKGTGLVSCAS